jgi:hypothetical protein
MVKCYGEFSENGKKIKYSLIAKDMFEADQRFVEIANKNGWLYNGILKIEQQ